MLLIRLKRRYHIRVVKVVCQDVCQSRRFAGSWYDVDEEKFFHFLRRRSRMSKPSRDDERSL